MKRKIALCFFAASLFFTISGCKEEAPMEVSRADEWAAPVSAVTEDDFKKIGEPVESYDLNGSVMEYTVEKVQIFDHYTDSGIPKEDFGYRTTNAPFVLVDIKCKKISGPEWKSDDDYHSVGLFSLTSKEEYRLLTENDEISTLCEICYFRDHMDTEDVKLYWYYWVEPGEEKVIQIGWCLFEEESLTSKEKSTHLHKTDGLLLRIGGNIYTSPCIDLSAEKE